MYDINVYNKQSQSQRETVFSSDINGSRDFTFILLVVSLVDWKQQLNIKSREEFNLPEFKHAI